jgi:NTE family protein
MDPTRRGALTACLTGVFGDGHDDLIAEALPFLEWVELNGGQTLVREGGSADAVYFVVSGRLRAHATLAGERVVVDEVSRGGTVGEAAVLMKEAHPATVSAVRDSVLARMPAACFEELWRRYPAFSSRMARLMVARTRRSRERPRGQRTTTIGVVPISDGFDTTAFAEALVNEIGRWGAATLQARGTVEARFGQGTGDARPAQERYHALSAWLDEVERDHDFTVLLADEGETEWTRRCIRHADEVVFVARADAPLRIHPIEERLCMGERSITAARQSLVLLHPESRRHPSGTTAWLDRRPVDAHYHVRPERPRDVARLARVLTGNSTGLVLAGGGARGFAHLGVYKALEEAGVEIDLVGGTSVGAMMAAYVSLDRPAAEVIELARRLFAMKPTGDFSLLPLVSLFKGKRLEKVIREAVLTATGAESDVLDSWRTMFCVASSFSGAREVVITRGSLIRALRASASIVGVFPPVPHAGELLVDGAVFNNFPTDVMTRLGAHRIVGVDLSRRGPQPCSYEELPGTFGLLADMIRGPNRARYGVPSFSSLLVGTAMLYSESRRQQARETVDVYINPDVVDVGLLEWSGFDRAVELGYQEARKVLSGQ